VKTYSEYVNNFTEAMTVLESRIKKRPRFVSFLKEALTKGSTNLSLQGLLLKPIQRFPQYILILQVCGCAPLQHLCGVFLGLFKMHPIISSGSDATSDGTNKT